MLPLLFGIAAAVILFIPWNAAGAEIDNHEGCAKVCTWLAIICMVAMVITWIRIAQ